jgi:hypothetical protein
VITPPIIPNHSLTKNQNFVTKYYMKAKIISARRPEQRIPEKKFAALSHVKFTNVGFGSSLISNRMDTYKLFIRDGMLDSLREVDPILQQTARSPIRSQLTIMKSDGCDTVSGVRIVGVFPPRH